MLEKNKELVSEREKVEKYKSEVKKIHVMFHKDGVERENKSEPRERAKKVTFDENTNISEEKLELKRK